MLLHHQGHVEDGNTVPRIFKVEPRMQVRCALPDGGTVRASAPMTAAAAPSSCGDRGGSRRAQNKFEAAVGGAAEWPRCDRFRRAGNRPDGEEHCQRRLQGFVRTHRRRFARSVGAGDDKRIVLQLDNAGWHGPETSLCPPAFVSYSSPNIIGGSSTNRSPTAASPLSRVSITRSDTHQCHHRIRSAWRAPASTVVRPKPPAAETSFRRTSRFQTEDVINDLLSLLGAQYEHRHPRMRRREHQEQGR